MALDCCRNETDPPALHWLGDVLDWQFPMRPTLSATTALLLLLGTDVAEAADPAQLAKTAGFLLGNAHRCGVQADRVERAGNVIHRVIVAASSDRPWKLLPIGSCRDLSGERLSKPRRRRADSALRGGDRTIRAARATSSTSRHGLTNLEIISTPPLAARRHGSSALDRTNSSLQT